MKFLVLNYHWGQRGLLFEYLQRIKSFCERYGTDADVIVMMEYITGMYYNKTPSMMLFVIVDEDEKIIAHALVSIEDFFGSKYINILQYERDEKFPGDEKKKFFDFITEWGLTNGADRIKIQARNEAVAGLFEKYGFSRSERVLMERII